MLDGVGLHMRAGALTASPRCAMLQEWLNISDNVHRHWLPHPPARIWANADGLVNRNAGIRTALLQCCTAVSHAHGWACRRCILCNLFSLEGGPAAELMRVVC
jgi:hypothetical protein